MTRIAIIGGGKIGEALISGLLQAGHAHQGFWSSPSNISLAQTN